jgi:hypothetical protein
MSGPQSGLPQNRVSDEGILRLSSIFLGTTNLLFLTYLYGLLFFDTTQYFSFNDLATSSIRDVHLFGAIVRLLLPAIVGFAIARMSRGDPLREATVTGFLCSLLLCWPGIFFPRLRTYFVGDDTLAADPLKLFLVYGVFLGSYSVLARLGALAGIYYGKLKNQAVGSALWKKVKTSEVAVTIILGLATNLIWEILIRLFK